MYENKSKNSVLHESVNIKNLSKKSYICKKQFDQEKNS